MGNGSVTEGRRTQIELMQFGCRLYLMPIELTQVHEKSSPNKQS